MKPADAVEVESIPASPPFASGQGSARAVTLRTATEKSGQAPECFVINWRVMCPAELFEPASSPRSGKQGVESWFGGSLLRQEEGPQVVS